MTIYNELFKIRKDIHEVYTKLNDLNEKSKAEGSSEIYKQIDELSDQLQHLKLRKTVLERLSAKFHH